MNSGSTVEPEFMGTSLVSMDSGSTLVQETATLILLLPYAYQQQIFVSAVDHSWRRRTKFSFVQYEIFILYT